MHIEISKASSNREIAEFITVINADLLKEGDTITAHYPNGTVVNYKWEPEWEDLGLEIDFHVYEDAMPDIPIVERIS